MLGVIGGSGLYKIEGIKVKEEINFETPFGNTSDAIILLEYQGKEFFFLPRHGRGHKLLPTEIPVRANIWALKKLGVRKILSVSAVGSLKEEVEPGSFLLPDQFFDRTKHRKDTFFGEGVVGHVSFSEPTCPSLRSKIVSILDTKNYNYHNGGTYVCIEGPQFSTKAESNFYRSLGASVVGMTALPEAKLAREAQICYLLLSLVTDYDVWKEGESVTVEQVVKTLRENVFKAQEVIKEFVLKDDGSECDFNCRNSLENAIMSSEEFLDEKKKEILSVLRK